MTNIILAAIVAILATGTLYFLLLKERSIMGPLWRVAALSWGGSLVFLVLSLLTGCATIEAPPYCIVKDGQGRDVILFKPSREQSRRFDNSHTNTRPWPEFKEVR